MTASDAAAARAPAPSPASPLSMPLMYERIPIMYTPADTSATSPAATILAVTRLPRLIGYERSVSSVLFSFSVAIAVAIICAAKMITTNSTIGMNVVCWPTKPITVSTELSAWLVPRPRAP